MTSELETKVAELGITLSAKHLQLVIPPKDTKGDSWAHDAWKVTLSYQERKLTTSYSTGLGHRTLITTVKKYGEVYSGMLGNFRGVEAATKVGYTSPVTPSVADVVSSLLCDASCVDYSYDEWCSDLGYDTDSRKALDTYLQCQTTGVKLRSLFTSDTYQSLVGLEH